ncbi:MAG: PIG-L family deacetylase [Terriglobia bacterium]
MISMKTGEPKLTIALCRRGALCAVVAVCLIWVAAGSPRAPAAVTVQGAPVDTGYNVGSPAQIRATLNGAADAGSYVVFADIEYAGTSKPTRVELNRVPGGAHPVFEGDWPIPITAPTGLYMVTLRVEARATSQVVAVQKTPGFFAYRKMLLISRVTLDKAFYAPGERIQCAVEIENLSSADLKGLRVEFSNENYPWISEFSGPQNGAGRMTVSPSLGLVVLRQNLYVPAHGHVLLPMAPAGRAAFLQGSQVAIMGAGGPAREEKIPPPEVDRYTIAVWNHGRKDLLDMQFSPQVIVRQPGRVAPKPYSRNYTHPYSDEIDFTRYREFYPPGYVSSVVSIDRSRTMYTPGEAFTLRATINAAQGDAGGFHMGIKNSQGVVVESKDLPGSLPPPSGSSQFHGAWAASAPRKPGVYTLALSARANGRDYESAKTELAVNNLPSSLIVFCPHEDDEHPWAGLMRAMVEAGRPVHVVFFTGGDVGECERYFDGHPCDPVRAREFGTVRMAESVEALEHIGIQRSQIVFLGLPDGGSGEIWFDHIHRTSPFFSIYLAVDHAPYAGVFVPNLPYARDAVIDAVKDLITEFHPAMIATPHPDERHVDHRTANWFALKACQELARAGALSGDTVVLADRAYGSGGYKPAPYQYQQYIVHLSGETAALKQEMGWIYQSQDGNLDEGSRKTFMELPRDEMHYRIVDWQKHEGWNE